MGLLFVLIFWTFVLVIVSAALGVPDILVVDDDIFSPIALIRRDACKC